MAATEWTALMASGGTFSMASATRTPATAPSPSTSSSATITVPGPIRTRSPISARPARRTAPGKSPAHITPVLSAAAERPGLAIAR
jgi:hypothetical protein